MRDYFETVKNFSAADLERRVLAGSRADGVNACVECCDRWAKDGAIALEWYGANRQRRTLTFAELRDNAAKFAHYLQGHGWRVGAMYQPLFTAFGPAAIESRVTAAGGSKAKLVVTDVANRPKLKDVPDCTDILTVGNGFAEAIARLSPRNSTSRHRYLPVVSTFCFSSSFIFLTVGSWLLSPVVWVVVAGGLVLGRKSAPARSSPVALLCWVAAGLGGHLVNVRNKDARDQCRERRHFCVHHALLSKSRTAELVLGFKLLADRQRPDAFPGRCEDGVDQGRSKRRRAGFPGASWWRVGIGGSPARCASGPRRRAAALNERGIPTARGSE